MGKRKERRMAAMMAAGRRVKLDLFAEPTGDLVEEPLNEEDGGGFQQNDCPGSPKSPSSSGKPQANPLLLLGQYSDDEVDEFEGDVAQGNSVENSLKGKVSELSEVVSYVTTEDNNVKSSSPDADIEAHPMNKLNPLQSVNDIDETDISKVETTVLCGSFSEANENVMESVPPESQDAGDATVIWKTVMDEQSGSCYYWNVVTGETSWEMPHVFIRETLSVGVEGVAPSLSSRSGAPVVDGENSTALDLPVVERSELGTYIVDGSSNIICDKKPTNLQEVRFPNTEACEKNDMECQNNISGGILSTHLASASTDSAQDATTLIGTGEEARHGHPVEVNSLDSERAVSGSDLIEDGECKEKLIDVDQLVECCNNLLRRLTELDRLDGTTQGWSRRAKYATEVEIRLLDCKTLSPFGFSLLPLWLHYEARLKQLAVYINEEENSLGSNSDHGDAVGSESLASERCNGASPKNLTTESGFNKEVYHMGVSGVDGICTAAPKGAIVDMMVTPSLSDTDFKCHAICNNTSNKNDIVADLEDGEIQPNTNLDSEIGKSLVGDISEVHAEDYATACMDNSHLDVDMDVDMEVDDDGTNPTLVPEMASSINNIVVLGECGAAAPLPPPTLEPLPPTRIRAEPNPTEPNPCPPPEDDWIPPPPPPDDDPMPPPPPPDDDLIISQYSSSSMYPHHDNAYLPLSYAQQYSFTYTVLGGDCYESHTISNPDAGFYSHGVNAHLVEAHPQAGVATLNPIPQVPSDINNPIEPTVLYELPSTTLLSFPATTIEPSGFFEDRGSISCKENVIPDNGGSIPDNGGSVQLANEVACSSNPRVKEEYDAPFLTHSSDGTIAPITSSTALQVATTTVFTENCSLAVPIASAPPVTAAKNSSKVGRVKKKSVAVAPTLRSNKKVSTLVDKWKAAKEELHAEEEDKPVNAFEILERKRQREIEKWHAMQIASGEAQDNANFQPLGGDWREKVKRKKAANATGEGQTQLEQSSIDPGQQVDLMKMSENLPSGWQAYWDESSGQVYYGNSLTMETSWARPKC